MIMFLTYFGILKELPWRLWVIVIIALAIIIGLAVFHHKAYDAGKDAANNIINLANQKANDNANKGQKSVDDCYASGGNWDRDNGVCLTSPAGQ